MTFLASHWLWLLLFFGFYLLYAFQKGTALQWRGKSAALAVSMVLAVVALSRPALPLAPIEIERQGSDVIFAVDISRSMQAEDIAPTRLEAAKQLLERVVRADDVNRFGVLAFTTNPIILSPLTRDDDLLMHLFSGLDTSMVLTKGTNIANALGLAGKLSRSEHPIVVILTDGGDELGYETEAALAKKRGLVVNIVMLATAQGSTLNAHGGKLLRDEEGGIVVTSANPAIETVAEATGGSVIRGVDMQKLMDAIGRQGEKEIRSKAKVIRYRELFYYPLALALLAAMLGMTDLISRVRRRHA